jgi:hypothetical protein
MKKLRVWLVALLVAGSADAFSVGCSSDVHAPLAPLGGPAPDFKLPSGEPPRLASGPEASAPEPAL